MITTRWRQTARQRGAQRRCSIEDVTAQDIS